MAKRDGGQHEKEAQNWGGGGATRGGKANQDATWAEPNTKLGETDESGRKQELQKEGNKESEQNKIKISAGLVSGGTCILELARKSEVSDSTNL
ncbi:hypothetical protein TNCV_687251 [Trichonephila clavipes]|nr:hypothetical protein TNCV_687251 [Trichonephila clavipes]